MDKKLTFYPYSNETIKYLKKIQRWNSNINKTEKYGKIICLNCLYYIWFRLFFGTKLTDISYQTFDKTFINSCKTKSTEKIQKLRGEVREEYNPSPNNQLPVVLFPEGLLKKNKGINPFYGVYENKESMNLYYG